MRVEATSSFVGSRGTIPGNRQKMYRDIEVTLNSIPLWDHGERGYTTRKVATFTITPHDARLLARALVAEAKVVEAARRR